MREFDDVFNRIDEAFEALRALERKLDSVSASGR